MSHVFALWPKSLVQQRFTVICAVNDGNSAQRPVSFEAYIRGPV
jgi:hypothetical protein